MRGCGRACQHRVWNLLCERGGSKSPSVSVVSPPPPTVTQLPEPDVAKQAEQSYQAQLKYNPLLSQQQYETQSQYGPMYKALLGQLYPELNTYQQQVSQRIGSPTGYSPEQQSALDAIRQRQTDVGLRNIREGANLGGTLYGGRRQQAEADYLTQQGQAYTAQDIAYQQQQQAANQQALITLLQLSNPQVQQFAQGVTPSPDALLNAYSQSIFAQPAAIGFGPSARSQNLGFLGNLAVGAGSAFGGR